MCWSLRVWLPLAPVGCLMFVKLHQSKTCAKMHWDKDAENAQSSVYVMEWQKEGRGSFKRKVSAIRGFNCQKPLNSTPFSGHRCPHSNVDVRLIFQNFTVPDNVTNKEMIRKWSLFDSVTFRADGCKATILFFPQMFTEENLQHRSLLPLPGPHLCFGGRDIPAPCLLPNPISQGCRCPPSQCPLWELCSVQGWVGSERSVCGNGWMSLSQQS